MGRRFRLDRIEERLWDGDNAVPLTRKAYELLRFFAENPKRLLTKDEIREHLWRGGHVTETLVKEYVHDVRIALGDDPDRPSFIETVRGRGYRFIGELELPAGGDADRPESLGTDRTSVAVLPFDNFTGEERWSGFCRGIADDLVTDLARLPELITAVGLPPFSADRFPSDPREIAQKFGMRYMLRGSLQTAGSRLRVNVHLLRARDGAVLWSERSEFERRKLRSVHREIVARVISALATVDGALFREEVRRIEKKSAEELTAHELYMLGFHLEEKHEKGSVLRAFELLRRAVALEPEMPRAWIALGWCCYQISREKWAANPGAFSKMLKKCHLRAWQIDPNDPVVIMNASAKLHQDKVAAVCADYERAAELGCQNADVLAEAAKYIALTVDDPERALQLLSRSIELKPGCSAAYFMHQSRACYAAGDYEGVLAAARRAPDLELVRVFELLALAQLDRRCEFRQLRAAFARRYPGFSLRGFMRDQPIMNFRSRALFLEGADKALLR